MSSPNHKAGLAVVVGSDNRSQPRGKVKQNAFSSPRKSASQPMNTSFGRQSQRTPTTPQFSNGHSSPQQPNGIPPLNPTNGFVSRRPSNGVGLQQSNGTKHQPSNGVVPGQSKGEVNHHLKGVVPARPKLLSVEEALKYSPFSSIVPFSSGKAHIERGD